MKPRKKLSKARLRRGESIAKEEPRPVTERKAVIDTQYGFIVLRELAPEWAVVCSDGARCESHRVAQERGPLVVFPCACSARNSLQHDGCDVSMHNAATAKGCTLARLPRRGCTGKD